VDEENRRRTFEAATEAENRSMPMWPAAGAEAVNLRRTMEAAAAAEGQKETPAGLAGGGEGEDTVPRP
jgi:hypothetical protein